MMTVAIMRRTSMPSRMCTPPCVRVGKEKFMDFNMSNT